MRYNLQQLVSDVMARLGEIARPQSQLGDMGIPWPEDIVALRDGAVLGGVGARLILESPLEHLGAGMPVEEVATMRSMPCGLYGAEVRLPEGFLRLVSVKMAGWCKGENAVYAPGTTDWNRQWSSFQGIAGCPEAPRCYIDSDGAGMVLRCLGSHDVDDTLEWLRVWTVPVVNELGEFEFPEALYPQLVLSLES